MSCKFRAPRDARTAVKSRLIAPRDARVTTGPFVAPRDARVTASSLFLAPTDPPVPVYNQEFYDFFVNPTPSFGPGSSFGNGSGGGGGGGFGGSPTETAVFVPDVRFQITIHNRTGEVRDLSPYFRAWEFSDSRKGSPSATLTLAHFDPVKMVAKVPSPFGPNLSPSDDWYGWFTAHAMSNIVTGSRVANGYVEVVPLIGGKLVEGVLVGAQVCDTAYPWFVIDDVQFLGGEMMLSLFDFRALLQNEGQTMRDINWTSGDRIPVSSAVSDIARACGIDTVVFEPGFMDHIIPELRRAEGVPEQWILECLQPQQGYIYFVGGTMHVTVPTYSAYGPAAFTLTDNRHLIEADFRETSSQLHNKVIFQRLKSNQGVVGQSEQSGGDSLGRNSKTQVTFDQPVVSAFPVVNTAIEGQLVDAVWYDASGNPLSVGMAYFGPTPAAYMQFTYQPAVHWATSEVPGFKVEFVGRYSTGHPDLPDTGPWNFPQNDLISQQLYGIRPLYASIEWAMVPNATIALAAAVAVLAEGVRQVYRSNLTAIYNPEIKKGQMVAINDYELRLTGQVFFVEGVSHRVDHVQATGTVEAVMPRNH